MYGRIQLSIQHLFFVTTLFAMYFGLASATVRSYAYDNADEFQFFEPRIRNLFLEPVVILRAIGFFAAFIALGFVWRRIAPRQQLLTIPNRSRIWRRDERWVKNFAFGVLAPMLYFAVFAFVVHPLAGVTALVGFSLIYYIELRLPNGFVFFGIAKLSEFGQARKRKRLGYAQKLRDIKKQMDCFGYTVRCGAITGWCFEYPTFQKSPSGVALPNRSVVKDCFEAEVHRIRRAFEQLTDRPIKYRETLLVVVVRGRDDFERIVRGRLAKPDVYYHQSILDRRIVMCERQLVDHLESPVDRLRFWLGVYFFEQATGQKPQPWLAQGIYRWLCEEANDTLGTAHEFRRALRRFNAANELPAATTFRNSVTVDWRSFWSSQQIGMATSTKTQSEESIHSFRQAITWRDNWAAIAEFLVQAQRKEFERSLQEIFASRGLRKRIRLFEQTVSAKLGEGFIDWLSQQSPDPFDSPANVVADHFRNELLPGLANMETSTERKIEIVRNLGASGYPISGELLFKLLEHTDPQLHNQFGTSHEKQFQEELVWALDGIAGTPLRDPNRFAAWWGRVPESSKPDCPINIDLPKPAPEKPKHLSHHLKSCWNSLAIAGILLVGWSIAFLTYEPSTPMAVLQALGVFVGVFAISTSGSYDKQILDSFAFWLTAAAVFCGNLLVFLFCLSYLSHLKQVPPEKFLQHADAEAFG